ncbi:MAG: hypothetical protein KF691_00590 [Phycisphaeraceae bacterium]|nr:hypothetical protein [Phycisphaeraceae bacterium]
MIRPVAAVSVFSLSTLAAAGLTFVTDNRFVQSVNSFGQNSAQTPAVAFAPFNKTTMVNTDMESGSCGATSMHNSQMDSAQMSGAGTVDANAATKASSPLIFAGSGTSRFQVIFQPDAGGNLHLSGQLAGTSGKSTLLAELKQGANLIYAKSTAGIIEFEGPVGMGVQYTLTVSCAANTLLMWTGSPAGSAASASFSFTADFSEHTCVGDLNNDGFVDDLDFIIFVPAYNILDCADPNMPAGCPADLNRDGVVDDADFTIFVPAYNDLICP